MLADPPPPGEGEESSHFGFDFQTAKRSYSRGANPRPGFATTSSLIDERAQGMPGARRTHSLVCKNKKANERSHHRLAETLRHSLHDGVTTYSALSPEYRAC